MVCVRLWLRLRVLSWRCPTAELGWVLEWSCPQLRTSSVCSLSLFRYVFRGSVGMCSAACWSLGMLLWFLWCVSGQTLPTGRSTEKRALSYNARCLPAVRLLCAVAAGSGLGGLGWRLDLMSLEVSSNLNDSVILAFVWLWLPRRSFRATSPSPAQQRAVVSHGRDLALGGQPWISRLASGCRAGPCPGRLGVWMPSPGRSVPGTRVPGTQECGALVEVSEWRQALTLCAVPDPRPRHGACARRWSA